MKNQMWKTLFVAGLIASGSALAQDKAPVIPPVDAPGLPGQSATNTPTIQGIVSEKKETPADNLILTKQLEIGTKKTIWSHTSSAWFAFAGPEYTTQQYMVKQSTNIKWGVNTIETYLEHNSYFIPSGKSSDNSKLNLKYIYGFSKHWGVLYGYQMLYSPMDVIWIQESHDVGFRYVQMLTPKTWLFIEPTFRLKRVVDNMETTDYSPNARLYGEIGYQFTDSVILKVELEYVRRLTQPYDYDVYLNPAVEIYASKYFSLQFSHMMTYNTVKQRKGEIPYYYFDTTSISAHY